jgi:hypothetical protein
METLFEGAVVGGLAVGGVALLWLYVVAFRTSLKWGLAVFFIPILIPWFAWKHKSRAAAPAALLAAAIVCLVFPAAWTRLAPVDLGPRVEIVDGEKHITLTGWDRGAAEYRGLLQHPDAVVLQMANADVTDDTLRYVRDMKLLRELDLDNTQVGDAGMKSVADLPELQRLRISRTAVTDAGFRDSLQSLPKLRQLWCPETKILKASLDAWKQSGEGRRYIGGEAGAAAPETIPNDLSNHSNTP